MIVDTPLSGDCGGCRGLRAAKTLPRSRFLAARVRVRSTTLEFLGGGGERGPGDGWRWTGLGVWNDVSAPIPHYSPSCSSSKSSLDDSPPARSDSFVFPLTNGNPRPMLRSGPPPSSVTL
ncbi:hypothetical protein CMUS01_08597 [Colletotrichum musicola]|uniref:Uncharacterized protein n=1 Tax=Colletotrichum musicola TaxID=2175873 RepID=A0A8H6KC73_9PEZI|nr:hypothetical protein CMUS01_08597 [Colletotrichum musicola]